MFLLSNIFSVLGDPQWLAVVLAALAIVVSIWMTARFRPRTALSYSVFRTSLASIQKPAHGRVKILADGEEVDSVELVGLQLRNTGNKPIPKDAWETQARLDLGPSARLLTVDLGERQPPDLQPSVRVDGKAIVIEPLLLNPGDRFSCTAIITGANDGHCLRARIAGVNSLRPLYAEDRRLGKFVDRWASRAVGVLGAAGVLATLSAWIFFHQDSRVTLRDGRTLCGKVTRANDGLVIVAGESDQGDDYVDPIVVRNRDVKAIKKNAC